MTRVSLLGATGSIGKAALDLARAYPERIQLVSLAARSNDAALVRAAKDLGVRRIALMDPEAWKGRRRSPRSRRTRAWTWS